LFIINHSRKLNQNGMDREGINILLVVILGFVGAIMLLIGYLVKQNQSIESISLPNRALEKVRDKVGFSRFAGNRVMRMGVGALITAILIALLPQFLMMAILLFILLTAAFGLELIFGCKRYL
jgi:hypothetical protein